MTWRNLIMVGAVATTNFTAIIMLLNVKRSDKLFALSAIMMAIRLWPQLQANWQQPEIPKSPGFTNICFLAQHITCFKFVSRWVWPASDITYEVLLSHMLSSENPRLSPCKSGMGLPYDDLYRWLYSWSTDDSNSSRFMGARLTEYINYQALCIQDVPRAV